ncbi:hypothetical protein ACLIX5_004448 [Salmonella enterica subsp. enterica serovar Bredeney]
MKRYHVISIAVLVGLIVGLSVSKAAEAADLYTCTAHYNGLPEYSESMFASVNPDSHLLTLQRPKFSAFHARKTGAGTWLTMPHEFSDDTGPQQVIKIVSKGVFSISQEGEIVEVCYKN